MDLVIEEQNKSSVTRVPLRMALVKRLGERAAFTLAVCKTKMFVCCARYGYVVFSIF